MFAMDGDVLRILDDADQLARRSVRGLALQESKAMIDGWPHGALAGDEDDDPNQHEAETSDDCPADGVPATYRLPGFQHVGHTRPDLRSMAGITVDVGRTIST